MALEISYMGTKRQLSNIIAEVIQESKSGVLLDVFSGMGAVGAAVGMSRPVWNNDVQMFASTVSRALFTTSQHPPSSLHVVHVLYPFFSFNRQGLEARVEEQLRDEDRVLRIGDLDELAAHEARWSTAHVTDEVEAEREALSRAPDTFPYRLCTITYAHAYFGIRQALELDSVVYGIHRATKDGCLSQEDKVWLLVAAGHAALRVATTTGHFAQYLSPKATTLTRYLAQRKRSLWNEFLRCIDNLSAVGTADWRALNKVYNTDSLALLESNEFLDDPPAVVYADPPYTDDQFSRYYHVWESIIKYDYPCVESKGRYRQDRFCTPFSLASKVKQAFERLACSTASLGADLVLSYPGTGLLHEVGGDPMEILSRHYTRVSFRPVNDYMHSTFGASKGNARSVVSENIYLARN